MSVIENPPPAPAPARDAGIGAGPSRALSLAFIALSAVALIAYLAAPERGAGIQRVLEWLRAWVQ